MNDKVLFIFEDLYSRYQKYTLSINDLSKEESISPQSLFNRIKEGRDIPNYLRVGTSKNSKILFNLLDVAFFIANETEDSIDKSKILLLSHIQKSYKIHTLGINSIAKEMGVTYGTALTYYRQGYLPKSKRIKKGKIRFNVVDFVKFLENTIKTV